MKYYLILSAICFFINNTVVAVETISKQGTQVSVMVKSFFDKIIYKKSISCAEEDFYFGKHGGILGESLYSSLNSYFSKDAIRIHKGESPIGVLLHHKLYDILKDKQRFSFALSSNVYTVDRENVSRTGVNATFILFVRAIPLSGDKYFNDIAQGVNFIFAINYKSEKKDSLYIDLVNSYINGTPFYKFLGFYGDYASGLELPKNEIKKIFRQ